MASNKRYTLFRNKLPRPAGQGASRQVRGIVGVSGSQTGGQGIINIAIPELVQSGGTLANTSWPLNLPASGKQTHTWSGHRDRVLAVAVAPDGKTIASRGLDQQLRLWEAGRDEAVRTWEVAVGDLGAGL